MQRSWRVLVVVLGFAFLQVAFAKSYRFDSINQDVYVQANGVVRVEDTRVFNFDGQFKRAFLEIVPRKGGRVQFVGVQALDGKTPTAYTIAGNRITWDSVASNETRTVRISYDLYNELQTAQDATLLDRRWLEDTHVAVGAYTLRFHVPRAAGARNHRAFVFTSRARIGKITPDPGGTLVTVTLPRAEENEIVRGKLILSEAIGPITIAGKRFETWLTQTKQETERFRQASQQASQQSGNNGTPPQGQTPAPQFVPPPTPPLPFWAFLLPVGLVGFVLSRLASVYQRFGKEPLVPDVGRYFREPPEDIPPGAVPYVMSQTNPGASVASQAIGATILDFARRGNVAFERVKTTGLFGLGASETSAYRLLKAPAPDRPEFEQELWTHLRNASSSNNLVTTQNLAEYSRRIDGLAQTWGLQPRPWYEETHGALLDQRPQGAGWGMAGLGVVAGLVTFGLGAYLFTHGALGATNALSYNVLRAQLGNPVFSGLLMLCGAVLLGAGIATLSAMPRWNADKLENANKWRAYRNFLADFSQLENAPPEHYKLWDYHFVYAAALGVADQYLRHIGTLMQRNPGAFPATYWMGHPAHAGAQSEMDRMAQMIATVNSMQDITRNLGDLESSLNAQETRTSSGWSGGFGGSSMGDSSGGGGSSGAE